MVMTLGFQSRNGSSILPEVTVEREVPTAGQRPLLNKKYGGRHRVGVRYERVTSYVPSLVIMPKLRPIFMGHE